MYLKNHPSTLLREDWIKNLRFYAHVAEEKRELRFNQLELFYEQNWFKALVPKKFGGEEWSLPELAAFEEAIAWADGSAGWVFTLCSGAGWFTGFMDELITKSLLQDKRFCIAGSGEVGGTAQLQPDGTYLVSGLWKYATGSPHATAFTANCLLLENDKHILNSEGKPTVIPLCFLKNEVEIVDSWHPIGLKASASNSFEVHEKKIPLERVFAINAIANVDSALYRYPFQQFAEVNIAFTICGICIHYMEECLKLWNEKEDNNGDKMSSNFILKNVFKKQLTNLENARENLRITVRMSWETTKANIPLTQNQLSQISYNALYLVTTCRKIVNELFPYTGLTGTSTLSSINQVWRDFQTGSQHAIFTRLH